MVSDAPGSASSAPKAGEGGSDGEDFGHPGFGEEGDLDGFAGDEVGEILGGVSGSRPRGAPVCRRGAVPGVAGEIQLRPLRWCAPRGPHFINILFPRQRRA